MQYSIMDIYVCSSRGRGLTFPNISVIGGGKLDTLTTEAIRLLDIAKSRGTLSTSSGPYIIYMIGGIPDATQKIRDRKYEEVVFIENTVKASARLTDLYETVNETILAEDAIPCFATIPTMSLTDWNHHRMSHHRTSYLIHHKQYDDMQYFLNQTIINVNHTINNINNRNLVDTPNLANCIMNSRGANQGYRVRYSRLEDGCHPIDYVVKTWQGMLERSSAVNRHNLRNWPFM